MSKQKIKIANNLNLNIKAKAMYAKIALLIIRARHNGKSNITIDEIARAIRECRNTVQKYLQEMQDSGYLQIVKSINQDTSEADATKTQSAYHLFSTPQNFEKSEKMECLPTLTNKELYSYEEPTSDFMMLDADVVLDERLTLTSLAMYMLMEQRKSKANQRAYITVEKFKEFLGIGKIAYENAINILKKCGYVKRKRDTKYLKTTYYYTIIISTNNFKYFEKNKKNVQAVMISFNDYIKTLKVKKSAYKIKNILDKILSLKTGTTYAINTSYLVSDDIMANISNYITIPKLKRLCYVLASKSIENENYIHKSLGLI